MLKLIERTNVKEKIKLIESKQKKSLQLESILDPAQETLNPALWTDNKLKADVRKNILDTVLKIIPNPMHIYLMGSNTGYNYNATSDIDVHIEVAVKSQEEADVIYDKFPKDMMIGTAPVQFYVYFQDEFTGQANKGAIYDLQADKWIEEPVKEKSQIPYTYAIEISKMFMSGIDNSLMEFNSDVDEKKLYEHLLETATDSEKAEIQAHMKAKDEEIKAKLDSLAVLSDMLWLSRANSYKKSKLDLFVDAGQGNMSIINMVYKTLEKFGYKEKIRQAMVKKNELMKGAENDTQSK